MGGSLAAVHSLVQGAACALHLAGGRHHAGRAAASGFCYVNDVVLSALALRHAFGRVLVLDVDCHHGDGTEAAFADDDGVVTVSWHRHGPGFYPASGAADSCSIQNGVINVPYGAGIGDDVFCEVFDAVVSAAWDAYKPAAVLLVAGVDALARDPSRGGNLTHLAFKHVTQRLLRLCAPSGAKEQVQVQQEHSARTESSNLVHFGSEGRAGHVGTHSMASSADMGPPTAKATAADMGPPTAKATAEKPVRAEASLEPTQEAYSVGNCHQGTAPVVPLLILGGGGYAPGPSAVAFSHIVAEATGQSLPPRVPEHQFLNL